MSRCSKSYVLDQCALYRCSSRKRLFKLLQTTESKYKELQRVSDLYKKKRKLKKDGGTRTIFAPRYDLKRIQKRISELLMRVAAPSFLMSPVRGRSNIDNAEMHRDASSLRLLDIEDFYPNCTASRVSWFFGREMGCPPDVVAILTWLTTREGALPQGSPASPILAYFAYRDMWQEIDDVARASKNHLTVYVDDVTISGEKVLGQTVWNIKKVLSKYGHQTKASKEEARLGTPATVTGVVLRDGALLLPNAQHQKRYLTRKSLEVMPEGPERLRAEAVLEGHNETERQITARNR